MTARSNLPAGLRRRAAIASVLAAMAASVLDASSVNIALPSIAEALHIMPATAAWLVIAYQGALVAALLPLAAFGERFGYRPTFVAGTALFGLCASGSSLADNLALLITLRALQGVGAAAIMALGVALLRQTVTEGELGKAISWNAMAVALMSASGPTIGASLLALGSWRLVFAGSVGLAVVALAAARALPERDNARRALDVKAVSTYVAIVPAFVVAAGLARTLPIVSTSLLVLGAASLVLFMRRERRRALPFLPLDLLQSPAFNRSILASIACFGGTSLALLMLPFVLHDRLGLSVEGTAMMMTPWPLAVLLTTPITARLLDHTHPARLCATGGMVLSVGLAILAFGSAVSGAPAHLLGIALCGIGFGLFQTPNNRTLFLAAPADRAASAGGAQGTARLTGQVIGALLASILLSAATVQRAASLAFGFATLAALAAATISAARRKGKGSF
jgi:MFS transporter, DHA2 family, multidrug resistance protein